MSDVLAGWAVGSSLGTCWLDVMRDLTGVTPRPGWLVASFPAWGKGFVDQAEEPLSAVHADFRVDVFGVGTHGVL